MYARSVFDSDDVLSMLRTVQAIVTHLEGFPRERAAAACRLLMEPLTQTRSATFVEKPPSGGWSYRVGLMANWLDDPARGDVLLLSAPVRATPALRAP